MVNKVTLIGRVGKDPEFRTTAGGTAMAKFSLATSEKRKKDGQVVETTEWHRCVAWERHAEVLRDYVHKGDLLYVEARIHYDSYENKEGVKVYTTDLQVQNFQMLGSKDKAEIGSGSAPQPAPSHPSNDSFGDGDLPF